MGDGHNYRLGASKSVHDLVRKLGHQCTTGLAVGRNRRSDFRVGFDERKGCCDRVEELTTETRAPGFVPANRLAELVRGRFTGADRAASPTEDLFFNPTLHVLPGLELNRAGFDRRDAPFDLKVPRSVGIGVRRAIKARQKFCGKFRASVEIESQGIGKHGFSGLGHASDLTLGFAAQQALAAGGPLAHDGPRLKRIALGIARALRSIF